MSCPLVLSKSKAHLGFSDRSKHIEAYVLQVIIIANHMNGKDTHVRGLKVLGPIECVLNRLLVACF